ncbi:hypothetical protein [Ancylobacter sp. FA202]|uniref:hypothetical protein n=1 Tax=Ancylobacter sp. FA202 TaxID=1111106 RepID=UPI0003A5769D|nr:hypothetical protein [Ancylobacter sp. FA202]
MKAPRAVDLEEQHDDHLAPWVEAKVQQAFEEELTVILGQAEADLREGLPIDWRALLADIESAAEGADFEDRRCWFVIDIDCPPIVETIIGEAWDLARAGETADALHRLSLLTRPKWPSEAACRDQYTIAMAETRLARLAPLRAALGPFADTPLGATLL